MAERPVLEPLRLVILDLDGVVYRGDQPVPGATELVSRLHGAGVAVRYATNNSMFTRSQYVDRLGEMGVAATTDEIVTSTAATITHLRRHYPGVETVLAVGAAGMVDELRGAEFDVVPAAAAAEAGGDSVVDAVVVGLDPEFDAARLAAAVRAIRAGAAFVATNVDARYPTPTGFRPGAGTMVETVSAAAGVEPLVIGKPQPAMFRAVLESTGTEPGQALVVGDNPDADIVAAHRAGIESVLVLTGVTSAAAVAGLRGLQVPDHVAPDPAGVWGVVARRLGR